MIRKWQAVQSETLQKEPFDFREFATLYVEFVLRFWYCWKGVSVCAVANFFGTIAGAASAASALWFEAGTGRGFDMLML